MKKPIGHIQSKIFIYDKEELEDYKKTIYDLEEKQENLGIKFAKSTDIEFPSHIGMSKFSIHYSEIESYLESYSNDGKKNKEFDVIEIRTKLGDTYNLIESWDSFNEKIINAEIEEKIFSTSNPISSSIFFDGLTTPSYSTTCTNTETTQPSTIHYPKQDDLP